MFNCFVISLYNSPFASVLVLFQTTFSAQPCSVHWAAVCVALLAANVTLTNRLTVTADISTLYYALSLKCWRLLKTVVKLIRRCNFLNTSCISILFSQCADAMD